MARAIDADAVLDRYYAEFEKQDICDGSQDRDWLMRCIEEAPTITPPNEWVSVEEKLPEDNTQVLMWSARWKIAEAGIYYNQHFWVYSEIGDGYIADNITHWMPVSSPPDKEQTK